MTVTPTITTIESGELEYESRLLGMEPEGCVRCREGAKMVLLITGLCPYDCFYCPISEKKKGKDVIFANELQVSGDNPNSSAAAEYDALEMHVDGLDLFSSREKERRRIAYAASTFVYVVDTKGKLCKVKIKSMNRTAA